MQSEVEVRSERELRRVLPRLQARAVHQVVERLPEVERLVAIVDDVEQRADKARDDEDGEGVGEGHAREPVPEQFRIPRLPRRVLGGVGRRGVVVGSPTASSKRCSHLVTQKPSRPLPSVSPRACRVRLPRTFNPIVTQATWCQKILVKCPLHSTTTCPSCCPS